MLLLAAALAAPRVVSMSNTYETLSQAWQVWAMEEPHDTNPVVDETGEDCDEGQSGRYWHMGGTFTGTADRTCTVSRGQYLFFPVFSALCFDATGSMSDSDLENCAQDLADEYYDLMEDLSITVDGSEVDEPEDFRVDTDVFEFTVPADNVIEHVWGREAEEGTTFRAASDGAFLLLYPLRPGTHTIDVYADFPEWEWTMDLHHTVIVR